MSLELKDVYEAIHELRRDGCETKELEALLVHTDDFRWFLQCINFNPDNPPCNPVECYEPGKIRLYGVKIIESEHVEPGSVFKIFKNDSPYQKIPGWIQGPPLELRLPTVVSEKKRHSQTRKIRLD